MHSSVTLTADEFKAIHNALCFARADNVENTVETIRAALAGAYAQDDEVFDRRMNHYSRVCDELGLQATWSMYEVEDLSAPHAFQGARTVTYRDHWGQGGERVVDINGRTWAALYVAADAAIRDSGDDHHVFIEAFRVDGNTLILSTGS